MCCGGTCVRALCEYHKDEPLSEVSPETQPSPEQFFFIPPPAKAPAQVFLVASVSPSGRYVQLDDKRIVYPCDLRYPDGSQPATRFQPGDMVVLP